jgi:outer membrane protein assembly factor BamA
MYSASESWSMALGQSSYWDEDRWRLVAAIGYADLELPLLVPGPSSPSVGIDWLLSGALAYTNVSRRVGSNWYVGLIAQYLEIEQEFSFDFVAPNFVLGSSTRSVALGPSLSYDTRDVPANAYEGHYFKASAVASRDAFGSNLDYESYSLAYRSYHQVLPSLVAAWEVAGCLKSDGVPLWDACRIGLRGFASTDYMGKSSWRAQAELRWIWSKRWGVAAFGGAGQITESLIFSSDHDTIPSYGAGLRFMVQPEQRIVMRLDYARSTDSDAWHLSVGQAF